MPALLVTAIWSIDDPSTYREYTSRVPELVSRYGGSYVARTTDVELVEGDEVPERLLVLRFASREDIRAMFADPAYLEIVDRRRRSSTATIVIVDES